LVADTHRTYINAAQNLAENIDELRELRKTLRQRVIDSPICDGAQYARNVEIAYREMWRRWCTK
jgi:predicted O-linked N-acetylglucosamine transferase (SPINDLY family)